MEKKIIAISGKKGSGKSTLARSLYSKLDNCMIIPIAGIAKQCVEIITNYPMNELQPDGSYDYSQKQKQMLLPSGMELGKFIREFAEAVRTIDRLVWIDSSFNIIENSNCEWFIIPDLRLKQEYNFINELNNRDGYKSFIFRINAGSGITGSNDGREASHYTERELDNVGYDDVFTNKKGMENVNDIASKIARKVQLL